MQVCIMQIEVGRKTKQSNLGKHYSKLQIPQLKEAFPDSELPQSPHAACLPSSQPSTLLAALNPLPGMQTCRADFQNKEFVVNLATTALEPLHQADELQNQTCRFLQDPQTMQDCGICLACRISSHCNKLSCFITTRPRAVINMVLRSPSSS